MRWLGLAWVVGLAACGGVDADGDGFSEKEDCDDANADVFPGAPEVCNGVDDDCSGVVDDPGLADGTVYFEDLDADGFGGQALPAECEAPAGAVARGGDCRDDDPDVFPGAAEVCNGIDDDCDALVDDDDTLDPSGASLYHRDADEDGYGSAASLVYACTQPAGHVEDGTDCDDADPDRNPGAPEVCNGKDDNCDVATGLLVDDEDPALDPASITPTWADRDRDGYGDPLLPYLLCDPPEPFADNPDDCDDDDVERAPDLAEVCGDTKDNDCDGRVDDASWWDDRWSYRMLVDVEAPGRPLVAAPGAAEVDFGAALSDLRDTADFDPDTVRVVLQDCDAAYPEVPFEWIDGVRRLLADGGPVVDATGDDRGSLAFLFDTDGDPATRDLLPADATAVLGVYFGSTATGPALGPAAAPPSVTAGVVGATVSVDNGEVALTTDDDLGGVASALGRVGGPSGIGRQTGSPSPTPAGNGIKTNDATAPWLTAVGRAATSTVQHTGGLVSWHSTEGSATDTAGGLAWRYDWLVFAHRPEVYVSVDFTTVGPTHVGPEGAVWSQAVRPYQIDNLDLRDGGSSASRDPGFTWVHGAYAGDTEGIWLGWRDAPASLANPTATADGRFLALAGQDAEPAPTDVETDLPGGEPLLERHRLVVLPHAGLADAAADDFFGAMEGLEVVVQPAARR